MSGRGVERGGGGRQELWTPCPHLRIIGENVVILSTLQGAGIFFDTEHVLNRQNSNPRSFVFVL